MENNKNQEFFEENDKKVSEIMCQILLYVTLVFPIMFICSALKIFRVTYAELAMITPIGVICTFSPTILRKLNAPVKFIKYYSIVSLGVIISVIGTKEHIGIYLTYVLALALSCLYFDKKFTIQTAIITYICMILSLFFRSKEMILVDGRTPMTWFIAVSLGYTIEFIVMTMVFVKISDRAHNLLNELYGVEKVKEVLDNCESASKDLSNVVENLKTSIETNIENNKNIEISANITVGNCNDNLDKAQDTSVSIQTVSEIINNINDKTNEMKEITDSTYDEMKNYISIMNKAVNNMEAIESSSKIMKEVMEALGESANQISNFTQDIADIASQTNILAINANIEAARAGEEGKGFSVVANQVGILAEESRQATQNIVTQIDEMMSKVLVAKKQVNQNDIFVKDGIESINDVKHKAKDLEELQEVSKQKIEQIDSFCKTTKASQENVEQMVEKINMSMNEALSNANEILMLIKEQDKMASDMNKAFFDVQNVSKNLLEISRKDMN